MVMGMIRLLIIALVALLAYTIYRKVIAGPWRGNPGQQEDERLGRLVQDPQCHVYVDSKDAVRRKVPGGDLYFCSETCADEFINARKAEQGKGE